MIYQLYEWPGPLEILLTSLGTAGLKRLNIIIGHTDSRKTTEKQYHKLRRCRA